MRLPHWTVIWLAAPREVSTPTLVTCPRKITSSSERLVAVTSAVETTTGSPSTLPVDRKRS